MIPICKSKGLPSQPGYDVAKRQMRGFGGMITFDVKGGMEAAKKLATVRNYVELHCN